MALIAIAEDNVDFATILETLLQLWGYTVKHYTTIAATKVGLAQQQPAMLILDGQMPDGQGYHLYLHLRQDASTQRLPVLLLSVSDDIYQQARIARDHDPYLFIGLKPVPIDEIQRVIAQVVET